LKKFLKSVGIKLKASQLNMNVKELLPLVMYQFIGPPTGFVDMCVQHIPSPKDNAEALVSNKYIQLKIANLLF
jgi:U5 small nuclear ribonucleoprotein component